MYNSISDILEQCESENKQFWEVVLEDDMVSRNVSREESVEKMKLMLKAMDEADSGYDKTLVSNSGMAGGNGELLAEYNRKGLNLCGEFVSLVMEKAIKMGESNACMRRIVAAPTAGSCGVIPAVILSYRDCFGCGEEQLVKALYVAAGIGKVIAENAFIAGASGGCQAEIGSAAAMAAGALAFLQGSGGNSTDSGSSIYNECVKDSENLVENECVKNSGSSVDNESARDSGSSVENECARDSEIQIVNAAALALKNMLGLACDPVGGLVEVPCIKRNSYGAVNAVSSAQLAMAGIRSAISLDDVIDSMRRIGSEMPDSIKETGKGGLAVCESAVNIKRPDTSV